MQATFVRVIVMQVVALTVASHVYARGTETRYPTMAPLNQYLMADRNAEIALARSAAPKSISDHAEILVLESRGYETAVKGTNGFVCLVERSWDAAPDDPQFWNSKIRGPDCLNPQAARSVLPVMIMKTNLALAGKSAGQIGSAVAAAFDQKTLALEPGSLCYMMSKQGFLGDTAGRWHPHLMFYVPLSAAKTWGAGLPGSPILASDDAPERLTVLMIPVARWSDGTADSRSGN
ncbi:MAG TPA: hypothetical protein VMF66_04135 [Candidatus Acidoferrum sp.]|nr:hypothetical protein [Candidatus Acidoferrum sp.]